LANVGEGGRDSYPIQWSEWYLRQTHLVPFKAAIEKAGARSMMTAYNSLNGKPSTANDWLLTDWLKREIGFKGFVISDASATGGANVLHMTATDYPESSGQAINAGLDVIFQTDFDHHKLFIPPFLDGKISRSRIDDAVRRVLRAKFELGLFENPYIKEEDIDRLVSVTAHKALAAKAAGKSIVLLKNEKKLLPLKKDIRSIAIIGPDADNKRNQLGDYIASKVSENQDIVTVLEGIRRKVSSKTKITYVKGCNVMGNELNEIAKAKTAAKNADVAIVVVGENERYSLNGPTDGEGCDISTLDLTGLQDDLVKAVYDSGTPTIVVLINGRPLSTRWIAEHVPAIIEPWFCGEKGGLAVADVIFGNYNPSGRLPITIPRNVGQLPCYYNYKYTKGKKVKSGGYVDLTATSLVVFG